MIEEARKPCGIRATEVVKPPPVVLAFQGITAILESAVSSYHLPGRIGDGAVRPEKIWRENDTTIRDPKLGIFGRLVARLALLVFVTAVEVNRQTCRQLLMILKV